MRAIVFYSWQSDVKAAACRTLIEDALKAATKAIADDDFIAVEPVVDRDTQGVAGSPDIGQPDWRHDSPNGTAARPLSPQEVDDIVAYLASLRSPATAAQAANNAPRQPAATTATGR